MYQQYLIDTVLSQSVLLAQFSDPGKSKESFKVTFVLTLGIVEEVLRIVNSRLLVT